MFKIILQKETMPEAMRVGVVAMHGRIDSPGGLSCPTILATTTGKGRRKRATTAYMITVRHA